MVLDKAHLQDPQEKLKIWKKIKVHQEFRGF